MIDITPISLYCPNCRKDYKLNPLDSKARICPECGGRCVGNLAIPNLLASAEAALKSVGPKGKVNFKYTCSNCGERVMLSDDNKLSGHGVCCVCGHDQPITEGGYVLTIER